MGLERLAPTSGYVEGSPRLHYLQWGGGEAPVVLLLHGLTQHARAWESVAPMLGAGTVVALDLRGHGLSERRDGYRPEQYVQDVERAVRTIAPAGALAVVGHSMGSLIAMRYTAEHPEQVRAAVFMDIDARPPRRQAAGLNAAGARPGRTFASIDEARERVRGRDAAMSAPVVERVLHAGYLADGSGGFIECYDRQTLAQFAQWDNLDLLPRIACPTLVLRGAGSGVHTEQGARAMVAALPNVRFHEFEDADHMLHIKRPDDVGAVMRDFLREAGHAA